MPQLPQEGIWSPLRIEVHDELDVGQGQVFQGVPRDDTELLKTVQRELRSAALSFVEPFVCLNGLTPLTA